MIRLVVDCGNQTRYARSGSRRFCFAIARALRELTVEGLLGRRGARLRFPRSRVRRSIIGLPMFDIENHWHRTTPGRRLSRRSQGCPVLLWTRTFQGPSKRTYAARHHSITSSAVASSEVGILRPSELAVLRLITR